MQIRIQARGFTLTEGLRARAERRMKFALDASSAKVRGVDVRLGDENGPRGGIDKRCMVRADLIGGPPVIVEQHDADLYVAIDRATERVARAVSRRLARKFDVRRDPLLADRFNAEAEPLPG